MGMPIAPTYIMLVILIAPAMVEIGILPLAGHLFINFFGAMSFVTPPVCVAAFVAAGIAGSTPMRVGFTAARLGIAAYLVPFSFCYSTGLLLEGSVGNIIGDVIPTTLGIITVAIGLSGFLFSRLNHVQRGMFFIGGLLLLTPFMLWEIIGFVLGMMMLFWLIWKKKTVEKFLVKGKEIEVASG